ncbi:MAG: two-component system, chemotaxis family, protein-glutamate methylesterase/glutaminase [Solirubrobacteraceae bacterium]
MAFVANLPLSTRQAVCVVLHVSPAGTSAMPHILGRAARLPVHSPADRDPLLGGHIYVAPPDHHLEIEPGRIRLTQAPRENGHRPAIDATMRTAAEAYAGKVVGFVLSGSRDDGTAGLLAIKLRGGAAVVQDPDEALYDAMPRSAIAHVDVDAVLPLGEMAGWLAHHRPDRPPNPGGGGHMDEPNVPHLADAPRNDATGTRFTCPDCGGVLFAQNEAGLGRFRCSVGHVFSIESLSTAQADRLEGALWTAVRALEDRAQLLRHMADHSREDGRHRSAESFGGHADDAEARAAVIRQAIEHSRPHVDDEAEAAS